MKSLPQVAHLLLGLVLVAAMQPGALPAVAANDAVAGAGYAYYPHPTGGAPPRPFLPLMHAAGVRWDRFDFPWPMFEPSPGNWQFAQQDALVSDVRAADLNILGIALWTPGWAASGPCLASLTLPTHELSLSLAADAPIRQPTRLHPFSPLNPPCATRPPSGLYEAWDDWTTADGDPINYWGRFVHTLVTRYRHQITHWEIWNEPDLTWFWNGSPADYAQLLKVGYRATKAACPECKVLFGGLAFYANSSFYTQVIDLLRADPAAPAHNYFFDVMSLHLYSRSSSLFDVTRTVRDAIRARIPDRPIWITESGVPVWDDFSVNPGGAPYIWSARQTEAASFVLQAYANARLAGAEGYFIFRASDDWCDKNGNGHCNDAGIDYGMPELYGLTRDSLTLRPAYTAYRLANTYLISPTWISYWNYSNGARRVTFWGTPYGKVSVLWNTTPTTTQVIYTAILPTATRVEQTGATQIITASSGAYLLTMPGATANNGLSSSDYIIGGHTLLVIEADTVPPPTITLQLTATSPITFALSWAATDAQTGILGYDVQRRAVGQAEWTHWLTRTTATGASFTTSSGGEWCFRARAWDRAGNLSPWAERCAVYTQPTRLVVTEVFGDADQDGLRDAEEPLVAAVLRWRTPAGVDVVSPTIGHDWTISANVLPGYYLLEASPQPNSGWLPRTISLTVSPATGERVITQSVALPPGRASVFVPVVHNQSTP
jgi:hypothetical protein